ncbi:hypothetical protein H0H92_000486 [Tricholoma furcatifolium]|nr:hypothetical protein H0H92_000486 [Tricholoma furcatifolium]
MNPVGPRQQDTGKVSYLPYNSPTANFDSNVSFQAVIPHINTEQRNDSKVYPPSVVFYDRRPPYNTAVQPPLFSAHQPVGVSYGNDDKQPHLFESIPYSSNTSQQPLSAPGYLASSLPSPQRTQIMQQNLKTQSRVYPRDSYRPSQVPTIPPPSSSNYRQPQGIPNDYKDSDDGRDTTRHFVVGQSGVQEYASGYPNYDQATPSAGMPGRLETFSGSETSSARKFVGLNQEVGEQLVLRICNIFRDKALYHRVVSCKGANAQGLLDMFQRLLDVTIDPPQAFHKQLIVLTQRLAGNSDLCPTCYAVNSVETDLTATPEAGGRFADVYRGTFRCYAVCLKMIRLDKKTDRHRFLKRISLVSPWMKNGDLQKYLKEHKSSKRDLLAFDVAMGLEFLHENDIIHGDLKSGNILVNDFGRACLTDFGLSSISDREILALTGYSSLASKGGTLYYMAPELFNEETDPSNTKATDVYAWGCVAYEIFTGAVPFARFKAASVRNHVCSGERESRPVPGPSWQVWGLTNKIWHTIESSWDHSGHNRPPIGRVVHEVGSQLSPNLNLAQVAPQAGLFNPALFREIIRAETGNVDMTVEFLESCIATSSDPRNGDMGYLRMGAHGLR